MPKGKYLIWAKKNKKLFVEDFLRGCEVKRIPMAIFMAGLPGAGKTEISKHLISDSLKQSFVRIDMDEIAENIPGYKPENAADFREAATLLLNNIIKEIYKRNISFVMDGTFGSPYAIKNIERAMKHKYKINVVYIHQDPKCAWDFTVAREMIEKRGIEFEGFLNSYFRVKDNLKNVLNDYEKDAQVSALVKDRNNNVSRYIARLDIDEFDDLFKKEYNLDSLKEYILGK